MESRKDPLNFHRCDICDRYGTRSLFLILKHVRRHRRKLEGQLNAFICYNDVFPYYKCEDCGFETNLKVSLMHHFNISHKDCRNENQFRNVMRQCEYCDFQTYSTLILLKHSLKCVKREDVGDEAYKIINWHECGQCSYKTRYKSHLTSHIKHLHSTNLKWYQCEKCFFKTKWKYALQQHATNIHADSTNIVWYHCDKCKFKTKWKRNLQTHMTNIHTDSANIVWYHCNKCEFKSKQKGNLQKHIAINHTDSANIVWYNCDKCEFKSKWNNSLKKHLAKMHTTYRR